MHTPRPLRARLALAGICCPAAAVLIGPATTLGQSPTDFRVRPETAITKAPKKKTPQRRARFGFASSVPGSDFECRLDARSFKPCGPRARYTRLKPRMHALRVRAVSPSGRADPTPAIYRWKVMRRYNPEQDVEGNDIPPPPGSPAAQFEKECAAHPGICS